MLEFEAQLGENRAGGLGDEAAASLFGEGCQRRASEKLVDGGLVGLAEAKDLLFEVGATAGLGMLARQGIKALFPVVGLLITIPAAFALSFSDPEHEKSKVQQLYRKLIEARSAAGDTASVPSLKDFERFVLQKTTDLKNKGGHEIEYTVSVEAGRVKLKARISS